MLNFRLLSGESAAVNTEAAEGWKSKLQQVLAEHVPEERFSEDEIELFY
jgi:hypothetical protein